MISPYSDLALEAARMAETQKGETIPGLQEEEERVNGVVLNRIKITTEEAARDIGKVIGDYYTINAPNLRERNREAQKELAEIISGEISRLLPFADKEEPTTFVVGLGNWRATPDALGPKVIGNLLMTRHLFWETPPELRHGMTPVCGIAPGVLGLTGIETGEIIRSIVEQIQPDLVLVIDALAAMNMERLGATVQISNAGIAPGSGVGGRRLAINQETMGVPVLAMGVPTVVHGWVLASEALSEFQNQARNLKGVGPLSDQLRNSILEKLFAPFGHEAVLTPKGIDEMIAEVSWTLAGAVSVALHPDINADNLSLYLY